MKEDIKIILKVSLIIAAIYCLMVSLIVIITTYINHLLGSSSCEVFTIDKLLESIVSNCKVLLAATGVSCVIMIIHIIINKYLKLPKLPKVVIPIFRKNTRNNF